GRSSYAHGVPRPRTRIVPASNSSLSPGRGAMDVKDDVMGYGSAALLVLMLGGCATRDAPDVGGRWQPVNRYADTTHAIPLRGAYVFRASPLDRTLRTLLSRW